MPFILWINEIFSEAQGPYEIGVIITRLKEFYSPKISRSAVYRAMELLTERGDIKARTCAAGRRPATYDYEAARRIARHVTHCKPPERIIAGVPKPPPQTVATPPKTRPQKKIETQLGRKRDTTTNRRKTTLTR